MHKLHIHSDCKNLLQHITKDLQDMGNHFADFSSEIKERQIRASGKWNHTILVITVLMPFSWLPLQ